MGASVLKMLAGAAMVAAFLFTGASAANAESPRRQVAVYVIGTGDEGVKKALGNEIFFSLVKSGKNNFAERPNDFHAMVAREPQMTDGRLVEIGRQLGLSFICVADVTNVFETSQISLRMINVGAGGRVDAVGNVYKNLKTIEDLSAAAEVAVDAMAGNKTGGNR